MGFLQNRKRDYFYLKHKNEIEEIFNKIYTNVNVMYTEFGTIEGVLGNMSYLTTKLIDLVIYRKMGNEEFKSTVVIISFWYTMFYLKVVEENQNSGGENLGNKFKELFRKVVEDIYEYSKYFGSHFQSDNYKEMNDHINKMSLIFEYHNYHTSSSAYIKTQISENISNYHQEFYNLKRDELFLKINDLNKLMDLILPDLKKSILENQ